MSVELPSKPQPGIAPATVRRTSWAAALLLAVHAALLAWGASVHSPTLNEPAQLAAGIFHWQFGRFDVYTVNPPLVRMVGAAAAVAAGPNTDWRRFSDSPGVRSEFELGEDFVAANGLRSFWLVTLARWACIPFSLLGGYVCYRWACELYSGRAGLLALCLWCFCPNILAHGQLITTDVAATSLGLAACYLFWRWLRRTTWARTLMSGLMLGLAELAKLTLLILLPLWIILWIIYRWPDRREFGGRNWIREIVMLAFQFMLATYVINLGYAFEGTGTRLGNFQFVSELLRGVSNQRGAITGNRFENSWLGAIPVPLPKNYVLGIDLQKRDFEHYPLPSYLRGEFREPGWWYYYLYALAIKVPLGTWLLLILAVATALWALPGVRRRDEFILLAPAIAALVFVSSQSGFNQHMRYVLPAFPFAFIWIGRLATVFGRQHLLLTAAAAGALIWSIASSLWIYPHGLSYFNELVHGPAGGPRHLILSNVDWGQDLLYLKSWLAAHREARPIKLAYFGYFDPTCAGIEYKMPDADSIASSSNAAGSPNMIPPGWYAVSVNFVQGLPWFIYGGDGSKYALRQNQLAAFQRLTPIAMAGRSIYIYHVAQH